MSELEKAKKELRRRMDIEVVFDAKLNCMTHNKCGLPIELCGCPDAIIKVTYPDPRPE